MCGVIGIYSKQPDIELVKKIFHQTMIRGKHATGVTYLKHGELHTIKEGIPANEFLNKYDFNDFINEDGGLYMIGHIRYSTSDIRFNQPFSNDSLSIAHNGVLSQEPVDQWLFKTETSNDSEMILRSFEAGSHPLVTFAEKSMAVVCLSKDRTVYGFRNHERPLWVSEMDGSVYFTSTQNIAKRSGLTNTKKCEMFYQYAATENTIQEIAIEYDTNRFKDLQ
jgi:glutamine phosphoribosylpyrophosphate amidotransferase